MPYFGEDIIHVFISFSAQVHATKEEEERRRKKKKKKKKEEEEEYV